MKISKTLIVPLTLTLMATIFAGCQQQQTATPNQTSSTGESGSTSSTSSGKLYSLNMADCGGFTAQDASQILGTPAAQLKMETTELYEGTWTCSYGVSGDYSNRVSFTVTHEDSAADAIDEMDIYRSHLSTGSETVVGEGLENGAYSEISGIGDDAVWTDINNTLLVRKGNVTVQFMLPDSKEKIVATADLFMSKL